MRILDKLLTRRRDQPSFSVLPTSVQQRLALACQELSKEEEAVAARLGLPHPPRLLLVDEEGAVILALNERTKIS